MFDPYARNKTLSKVRCSVTFRRNGGCPPIILCADPDYGDWR